MEKYFFVFFYISEIFSRDGTHILSFIFSFLGSLRMPAFSSFFLLKSECLEQWVSRVLKAIKDFDMPSCYFFIKFCV